MAERQTYAVVCNDAIRGGSARETLGLLHWHNRLARGVDGASPFIECRTARTRKRMSGAHSWLDAHRDAEWKLSPGVTVVFCTQACGRDAGAKFLQCAFGGAWIAEGDLGAPEVIDDAMTNVEKVDVDSKKYADVTGGARDDAAVAREIFRRAENSYGHWMDTTGNGERAVDRRCGSTSVHRMINREQREGIRPRGEHSRPAGPSGR